MTTLHQSQPPVLCWELFERDNQWWAQECPGLWWRNMKAYPIAYDFRGQHAHYVIVSNDAWLTRPEALEWCKKHYAGRLTTRTVTLPDTTPLKGRKNDHRNHR